MGTGKGGPVPNIVLFNLRDRLAQSQEDVADALNALGAARGEATAVAGNHISRWERGIVFPSPLYRQLLAEHFQVSAADLGLVRPKSDVPRDTGAEPAADERHLGRSFHIWDVARTDDDPCGVVDLSRRVMRGRAGFRHPSAAPPTTRDVAPLRGRLDVRSDVLEVCLRQTIDGDDESLVGYVLAYPLDADATARILAGEVTGADQIADSHVATTMAKEGSLYVAMVLGADPAAPTRRRRGRRLVGTHP
jgi:transcriptional regulator with XRE-family HTH domain